MFRSTLHLYPFPKKQKKPTDCSRWVTSNITGLVSTMIQQRHPRTRERQLTGRGRAGCVQDWAVKERVDGGVAIRVKGCLAG